LPSEIERYNTILKYIRDNKKATKAETIRHMDKEHLSSTVTTHKDIQNLIREKKVNVLKDKPNSQMHHLVINDKNEFIRIDKELSEIESIINVMSAPVQNIFEDDIGFPIPYKQAVEAMLQVLLVRTNRLIHSKEDSQILYTKITELLLKLILQFWNINDSKTFHPGSFKLDLNLMKKGLLRPKSQKSAVSAELLSNLIEKIENFEKQFLDEK
jgi:hypothetical protein